MKILIFLTLLVSPLCFAEHGFKRLEFEAKKIGFPLDLAEKLREMYENEITLSADEISVIIDEYADKIFTNLQLYIIGNNINSIPLPNETLKLEPTGSVDLYTGVLTDISTISRSGDVILTYSPTDKTLVLVLPFKFDDLKFTYDYHTKVSIISIHGGVQGSIQNCQINAQLSFHFADYTISLDHYDMQHTGDITVKFTGNKIIDWLTNAMTKAVTTILHPVIVGELQKVIRTALRELIDELNAALAKIITPHFR